MNAALKTPPHSIEAEQSVLGGMMMEPAAIDDVADLLQAEDFYAADHRVIFDAIVDLNEKGQAGDVVTISEHLHATGRLDEVGGLGYLGSIVSNTPSAANVKAYAEIVKERSTLRQVIEDGTAIAESGFSGKTSDEALEDAERRLTSLVDGVSKGDVVNARQLMGLTIADVDRRFRAGGAITGMSTGFDDLDKSTNGLEGGDLVVVAGRPAMGKTSFAMNIGGNAAFNGKSVAVFSLEMPSAQLGMRLVSTAGKISMQNLRSGKLDSDEFQRLSAHTARISEMNLHIDDNSRSVMEMRSRARRIQRKHGLDLIVIDYLQLMRLPGDGSKADRIGDVTSSLKALAKQLNVPIILLSQLNRSLESRPNKRPVMSDLRDSGSIEQDADIILFVYRDEVYNEDSPQKGTAEIIIGKQRNGPIGTERLTFRGQFCRFDNFSAGWQQ